MGKWDNNEEIKIFRQYLQIKSVQPDVDYKPCVEFLKKQAENLQLPLKVYYPGGVDKPIVVITWKGTQPELKAICLNSHMDVVPAFEEFWTHPPFAAEIDDDGKIFARGTQDMKCVGTQYLGAIRALMKKGITLKRTIHVLFVPDEETGGVLGMEAFVRTDEFKALNVGFALDESGCIPSEEFVIFNGQRNNTFLNFDITGTTGHGSILYKDTAGEKLQYIINKLMNFRKEEMDKYEKLGSIIRLGEVSTVNLTQVNGGVLPNVVPAKLRITFDIRLARDVDVDEFKKRVHNWCKEAGGGIECDVDNIKPHSPLTPIDDSNPFWVALKKATDNMNLKVLPIICPGGTDSKFLRSVGVLALGFTPINCTPTLLHAHDEFVKADTYLRGIDIFENVIRNIANVENYS